MTPSVVVRISTPQPTVQGSVKHRAPSAVLPEPELIGNLPETLATQVESVAPDNPALAAASKAAFLPSEGPCLLHSTTSTPHRSFMNWIPSERLIRGLGGMRR